jgi:hypothetical protein
MTENEHTVPSEESAALLSGATTPPMGIQNTSEDWDGTYRIDFQTILKSFEEKLRYKIVRTLSHSRSCRLYICCCKEYVDRPNWSWWRMCLVDALLTSFCKLQKRDNGVFNSFGVLCDSAFADIPPHILAGQEEIRIDVINIPKAWTKLSLIYEDWTSSVSNIASTTAAIRKRATQMESFRVACAGLENSYTQIIEQGLKLALVALRESLQPRSSRMKKRKLTNGSVLENKKKRLNEQMDQDIDLSKPKDAVLPLRSNSNDDLLLVLLDSATSILEAPAVESSAARITDSGSP